MLMRKLASHFVSHWHDYYNYMTIGLRNQVLSTQNTCFHVMALTSCLVCASFIESLIDFCIYDDILDKIQPITDKKLLHFKLSKLGQILNVAKIGFPRPGHNY